MNLNLGNFKFSYDNGLELKLFKQNIKKRHSYHSHAICYIMRFNTQYSAVFSSVSYFNRYDKLPGICGSFA